LQYENSIESCVADSDLILHLTEWKIYREIDPVQLRKLVKSTKIIDGRNALDSQLWLAAGWDFRALGRTNLS
jgi:UDPglucose 6-dehydrogenase